MTLILKFKPTMDDWTNGRTDERTKTGTVTFILKYEPTKDDGRTDERTNGRTDEGKNKQINGRKQEW